MKTRNLIARLYRDEANGAPDAGGTSAPAAAPASEGQDVNTDWSAMSDDSYVAESSGETPAAEPAAPAPAAQPAAPATPEPAAQPPAQPPAAAAQPAPEAQPTAQPAQPEGGGAEPTPEQYAAMRQQFATELEQYYMMDPETATRLQTEPEVVLPKLAAQLHMTVMDAVMAQLPSRVGAFIQEYNTATQRETAAKDKFFTVYPELKDHEDAVRRVGQMYRAANPTATAEQAVKAIGDFVLQSLGISRAPQGQPQISQGMPPAFVPATPAGGGAAPVVKSTWDEMIEPDA